MVIGILTLRFHLEGCQSLKEKRGRLSGVRDRFGRTSNIAICESDLQDKLQSAQWAYIATASDKAVVEASLAKIEAYICDYVDAVIVERELEYL